MGFVKIPGLTGLMVASLLCWCRAEASDLISQEQGGVVRGIPRGARGSRERAPDRTPSGTVPVRSHRLQVDHDAPDRVVVDVQDRELDAVITKGRSRLRQTTQGVKGQAADGLEVLFGGEAKIEAVVEQLERQRGVDLETRASQGLDRVGGCRYVVLVVDGADQLLEQVFQGDQ